MSDSDEKIATRLARLALALTAEKDQVRLLEAIIEGAMSLTNADGGTLYTLGERPDELDFAVIRNRSLGISEMPRDLPPVRIHDEEGRPSRLVVARSFVQQQTINIADAYDCADYDFSGTRRFDERLGYRSRSFLCVPLKDHEGEMVGVLQLINAIGADGAVMPFTPEVEELVEALASLAAAALTKQLLIDSLRHLFESFIKLIASAIDRKSPVTGKHCQQVPEIAMMIARAVNGSRDEPFGDAVFSDDELYELRIAAWLHDCGKICTPEYVVEKGTKLQAIHDRIELVAGRMREIRQSRYIRLLERLPGLGDGEAAAARAEYEEECRRLDDEMEFLRRANTGAEFMPPESRERVRRLAEMTWIGIDGEERRLLTDDEVENLSIARGTLTDGERQTMQDHAAITREMLESLDYPRTLRRVPEIAANHHEHVNGKGYPRGLVGDHLSLQARIMCMADIFEALTSPDRPYKKGMPLSQAMTIMGRMVEEGALDRDLFRLFVGSGVWSDYARTHMSESQIDRVDVDSLPGL